MRQPVNRLIFCRTLFEETRYMNNSIRASLSTVIEKHGLTHVQAHLLGELRSEDGQPIRQLADRVLVKPSNFTPLARSLEEAGLIERRQDATDKRSFRMYLTVKGRKVSEQIDKEFSDLFGGNDDETEALQQQVLEGFAAFRKLTVLKR